MEKRGLGVGTLFFYTGSFAFHLHKQRVALGLAGWTFPYTLGPVF